MKQKTFCSLQFYHSIELLKLLKFHISTIIVTSFCKRLRHIYADTPTLHLQELGKFVSRIHQEFLFCAPISRGRNRNVFGRKSLLVNRHGSTRF